ncbi:MAG TPA: RluA family pseudouridine synthase [Thermomicrobiales bacterium]|nr:RluA family pseudouridine synthase [Thermomicrobiales bacterium]
MNDASVFVVRIDVPPESASERIDRFVTDRMPDTSRSFVQRLIEAGNVLVNGEPVRASYKVAVGDRVEVRAPGPEEPTEITPAVIPIPIVFEDIDVMVFDKPAGLVVHPAPGHEHGTLVNVLKWLRPESITPGAERPGIVHRLDKDTSGLIVVAKTERARLSLLRQWQQRDVVKEYTALVVGTIAEEEATIDAPIGRDPNNRKRMAVVREGRPSVSHFGVISRYPGYTLLDVNIETGRTHQIRVHCAFIKHPVAGDILYGGRAPDLRLKRQFLHARRLRFALPGGQPIDVEAPLPADLRAVLDDLERERE